MNTVGNKIRALRVKKGFSQQNFAEELGISQPSYARLEQDDNRISIIRLMQIALLLETNAAKLLDDNSKQIKNLEKIIKVSNPHLDIIKAFNDEHITTLKGEIAFLRSILSTLNSGNKSLWIN